MDEDLQHLEECLYRLVNIARTLARDADTIEPRPWNEPYAYRAANTAIKASANLRAQLETRRLVSPLDAERPEELSPVSPPSKKSYPHVIPMGVDGK
jgi:hypothetical protein